MEKDKLKELLQAAHDGATKFTNKLNLSKEDLDLADEIAKYLAMAVLYFRTQKLDIGSEKFDEMTMVALAMSLATYQALVNTSKAQENEKPLRPESTP